MASVVPRSLFDQADPDNRTADPDWMAERVRAHHEVNARAAASGPCLPLNFGVLYSDTDLISAWLEQHETTLHSALTRVAGHVEWSLSLQEDTDAHGAWLDRSTPRLHALAAAVEAAGPGTAFLKARALENARASARDIHISDAADQISARLVASGCAVLGERPRHAARGWSVLAPRSAAVPAWLANIGDDLSPMGLVLRLSGPWPAYAFARSAFAEQTLHG